MRTVDAIIVGGGPAGASCAWELARQGLTPLILEKKVFPRQKLCAGWVTPEVFRALECDPSQYPFGIERVNTIFFHLFKLTLPLKTRQYSIRRIEFDQWMLNRSGAEVICHRVAKIDREKDMFVVDQAFRSRFIIGAGGTNCPVARHFFSRREKPSAAECIITLEKEFYGTSRLSGCHLWFFRHHLPGYAWLVPKAGGYLNIGIGGKLAGLKKRKTTIENHWHRFINDLKLSGHIRDMAHRPRGYAYYLRQPGQTAHKGNAFIIGDALGMATRDMGEGIGPAVRSGILAARAMASGKPLYLDSIARFSLPAMVAAGIKSLNPVRHKPVPGSGRKKKG